MRARILATIFVAFSLAIATPVAASAAATGVLQGTVTRGPTAGPCHIDQPCSAPFDNAQIQLRVNGLWHDTRMTDASGFWRFSALPVGSYTITIGGVQRPAACPTTAARVTAWHITKLVIDCDTGIR